MKIYQNIILASLLFFSGTHAISQVSPGSSCDQAGCSTAGSYQNLTGVSSMGTYSCLYSTPNPNWIAIGIDSPGSVHLILTQTSSSGSLIDVDFAVYGPYTSVAAGCPINGSTPTVDCSYSASATEYIDIPSTQSGEVYIILITNYNGSSGTISIQPNSNTSSTATTNCAINFGANTSSTPATCGQATGSVSATPNGGYAPYTYSWNTPGNPTTQTVNNVPPGTYTVTITSSPSPSGQTVNPTTATVTVQNINATYSATSTPSSCPNGTDGTATANFALPSTSPPATVTSYLWNDPNAQTTQTATGLLPGFYTCTITLSNGCSGNANINVGSNSVNYDATSTLVSCPGGSDGTATATMTPVVGTLSYAWDDVSSQTTPTAVGLSAGQYTCTITSTIGCTGTATVDVTEIPGMIGNITNQSDITCNSGNDGIIEVAVTQGTPPYSYSWDNSTSTANIADDLYPGTHTCTITDANGCSIQLSTSLVEPAPLSIDYITPDTQICPEDEITLTVNGSGGSSPYTYTWFENGVQIGTGTDITVDPENTNTTYCAVLSEACGSPKDTSCSLIYFPTPIEPNAVPDEPEKCVPGFFEFENTSINGEEIATTVWDFGSIDLYRLENGNDSTSLLFSNVGVYDLAMTVTSIYGCVYSDTVHSIIEVLQIPTADFNISNNPATIFETTVFMQNKSSNDVVKWMWDSPDSYPNSSNLKAPTFTFPEGKTGVYPITLIVETEKGCRDTTSYTFNVIEDILFYAPNSFTPDGDEHNQLWKIEVAGIDIYDFDLYIFNRWGQIVWESHDPSVGWDGTFSGGEVPAGSYVWRAQVSRLNNDDKQEFHGTINVLR